MSNYFDDEKNVRDYISMTKDDDWSELIELLARHVPDGSEVLELGMGPGADLDLLSARYHATGTDASQAFLDIYLDSHPQADVFRLDAVTMDTDRRFDAIYSNKVLHQLTPDELSRSFGAQAHVIRRGGIAFHSFWYGSGEEVHHGLRFTYHTEATIRESIGSSFEIVEMGRYEEAENNDSLYVVLTRL